MRLVFAGTPEVALPSLEALIGSSHEVVGVVTRPDAPAGRGRSLLPSPVRVRAQEHGIPVLTPRTPRDPDFQQELAALAPDCCPVVAYGALVPQAALDIPRHGWVNLHFSLLPAWRGAAPVQHAIRSGDEVTGATTFLLEQGLDTGPIFGVMTETIRPTDTSGDLLGRLALAGAGLLVATLDGIEAGHLVAKPQPGEGISHAPKVEVEDARVDWGSPRWPLTD
jgi:methionyl-tRNA formyltransferase